VTLRLALVGGPMYDGLYDLLGAEDVDVAVHADHPTLNREVAARLAAGDRIDVLSTHSKYAPSQRQWLRPLDGLVPGVAALVAPGALDLCRFDGELLSVPRNIDVRVLWWRTDRLESPPSTWQELDDGDAVFGFPGRESGLFGTFFEILVANGGCLFDDDARPTMVSDEAVDAVDLLCRLADRAPADLPDWHYDQVDAALLDGRVDLAAAWPGAYGAIRSSPLSSVLAPAPYLAGRERWVSYSGCHAWAIPRSCADVEGAVALITRLTAHDAAMHDAGGGSIPAHASALDDLEPADGVDAERLAITRRTIAEAMITYPALTRFPEVEDAGWSAINAALRGESSPRDAVEQIQRAAEEALA
jgi:multiple sugar transport system substrate-binding protein